MNTPPIKWVIYEPVKTTVTRIIPELAIEIGLNESIVLLQISFWINSCDNLRDERYWTYQTMKEMKEKAFPYWSVDTIRRTVHSLKKMGYIQIENHNKRKGDNTQWFALEPDKCSSLKSILCLPADYQARKGEQPSTPPSNLLVPPLQTASTPLQDRTTLPEITTESNTKTLSAPIGTGLAESASKIIPDVLEQAAEVVAAIDDKPKKPRDPVFDAVAKYIFGMDPLSIDQKAGGRVGPIAQWLNGKSDGLKRAGGKVGKISTPAKPEHVIRFAQDYKRQNPDINMPLDFIKFVEAWRKWATKFQRPTNTSTDPAHNLSIPVPVVPMLMQQQTEELEPVI